MGHPRGWPAGLDFLVAFANPASFSQAGPCRRFPCTCSNIPMIAYFDRSHLMQITQLVYFFKCTSDRTIAIAHSFASFRKTDAILIEWYSMPFCIPIILFPLPRKARCGGSMRQRPLLGDTGTASPLACTHTRGMGNLFPSLPRARLDASSQ